VVREKMDDDCEKGRNDGQCYGKIEVWFRAKVSSVRRGREEIDVGREKCRKTGKKESIAGKRKSLVGNVWGRTELVEVGREKGR
jgi:hypothetical protein